MGMMVISALFYVPSWCSFVMFGGERGRKIGEFDTVNPTVLIPGPISIEKTGFGGHF